MHQGNTLGSLESINKAIDYAIEFKQLNYEALAHEFAALQVFGKVDMPEEAVLHLKRNIECRKKLGDYYGISTGYYLLGWVEYNFRMTDSSLVHLRQASYYIDKSKTPWLGTIIEIKGWLGNAYSGVKMVDSAIYIRKSLMELARINKIDENYYDCSRYVGIFYYSKREYDSAYKYLVPSHLHYTKIGNELRAMVIRNYLILTCLKKKDLAKAKELVKLTEDTTAINYNKDYYLKQLACNSMFEYYNQIGDYKTAIHYQSKYIRATDSLNAQMRQSDIIEKNNKYKFQKEQAKLLLEQQRKDFEALEDLKQQQYLTYASMSAVVVVIILLFMAFKVIKQKQSAYKLISEQKNTVEAQKLLVEIKNKEIGDSIKYAKRLQEAILPNLLEIKSNFSDLFLLYKPKDIVAGDFYFYIRRSNKVIIAAADCTGHGVPGAMVSVVCSNALTRTVNEFGITNPAEVLNKTRELVLDTFSKSAMDVKDGMDISLITITYSDTDRSIKGVEWAGANNGLIYVHDNALVELKPDKQPVGLSDELRSFTNHPLEFSPGDVFYLYTDGYSDQFGGPKGKKFKHKAFVDLIQTIKKQNLSNQMEVLDNNFESWKGDLEQLDDVCIIGFQV